MPAEHTRKYNPPYISPVSFNHLIERLQDSIPGRFDRSFLDTMFSGSAGIQVMAALRFLNLIDGNNVPTTRLRLLVGSSGEDYKNKLREVCNQSYSEIFADFTFNLMTATFQQLEEKFTECYKVEGDVRRKCIKFFISIAKDSGISLSPFITQKVRSSSARGASRPPVKKIVGKPVKQVEKPKEEKTGTDSTLLEKLLDKFPDFDINWPDEQKNQWLDSFMFLMQKIYPDYR